MHFVVNSEFYGKINYKGPLKCNLQFMNIINKKKKKKCVALYNRITYYMYYMTWCVSQFINTGTILS